MTLTATAPAPKTVTGHPLVDMLITERAYPHLTTQAAFDAYTTGAGVHCVFLPGEAATNLETPDVAVVLPELIMAFQRAFDAAVAGPEVEKQIKADIAFHKTPNLVFYRDGRVIGTLPRVRDWSDYVARIPVILATPTPEADA
ncbi:hydrogenase accessory protein [uncultured Maritimibacter sp.]|jgi:hydrogenase-1 operon protein HyaE|uniref:hydrogenase accessory protein n=1 Tax=uncultured Maritimibacter sp. TaxID=991866 RepID=UPI002601FB20|nr:hydrogenase accessory protein [uncultured Maritimibacter sp.]